MRNEWIEERAAIMEYESGLSRAQAELAATWLYERFIAVN